MTATQSRRGGTTASARGAPAAPQVAGGAAPIVVVVLLLAGMGLVMVLSASSVQALRDQGSSWLYFQRQVLWLGIGLVAMIATARVDYRVWRMAALPALAGSVGMLLVVLLPGIGVRVSGSTRWIDLGFVQIQPSEVAKLAVLVFCADLLARRADEIDDPRRALRPVLVVSGVVCALVMKQPDMGTTMVVVAIVGAMLIQAGVPMRYLAWVGGIGGVLAMVLAVAEPYRRARVTAFIDPWADAANTGYQVVQSLVGMGSGGITGVGLGASRAKWGFLPNAHTDFIFAIIGEELGLLGSLGVVLAFVALACLGVRAAMRAPDRFGMLLALGLTAWIVGQAVINMGAVIGLLPVTGVPLPFVSAGGSSLIVLLAATGILVSVARVGVGRGHNAAT